MINDFKKPYFQFRFVQKEQRQISHLDHRQRQRKDCLKLWYYPIKRYDS